MAKPSQHNHTVEPPDELDGAKVIQWAWSGNQPFGFLPEPDAGSTEIYGLAICQYEGSAHFYRFSCDRNWVVQQDAQYNSIDDAVRRLPGQYKQGIAAWFTKPIP